MRSPVLRHVVRLRLSLVGSIPEIWREVVVDRDLSLADLRGIIQAVFDGQSCRHHLFTDTLTSPEWSRTRRRWGDRWTMIEFRDPTVIDEATAHIGRVLADARPLFYGHTCENGWLVEVEAHEDAVAAASSPPARVTGGERRAPLPCCRSAYEHAVLVGVLDDPAHPEREALRSRIERAIGPWAHFDPEEFDLTDAQRRLDGLELGTRAGRSARNRVEAHETYSGPLAGVVRALPRPARAGLERHVEGSGITLPTVVTAAEAHAATHEFAWVIARAADGGIPLLDGSVDPMVVQAGMDALGCDEERMLRIFVFARRGHLLYARNGRLLATKRTIAAAANASGLWSLLAGEVVRAIAPVTSGELFLLAIADGSLADPAIGARRSAEALTLLHRDRYSYDRWMRSEAGGSDCEQACDCSSDGSETWHDVVARAIRHAAADAAGEDASPLAADFGDAEARELGFAPEWLEEPAARLYAVATRTARETPVDEGVLLSELGRLIELLSMFGLERADDGSWITPPILRELARESLQRGTGYGRY